MLPATTVCRQATNECDLPEYCDGQMEHCPADFFVQDGHKCPNHRDVNIFDFFLFSSHRNAKKLLLEIMKKCRNNTSGELNYL